MSKLVYEIPAQSVYKGIHAITMGNNEYVVFDGHVYTYIRNGAEIFSSENVYQYLTNIDNIQYSDRVYFVHYMFSCFLQACSCSPNFRFAWDSNRKDFYRPFATLTQNDVVSDMCKAGVLDSYLAEVVNRIDITAGYIANIIYESIPLISIQIYYDTMYLYISRESGDEVYSIPFMFRHDYSLYGCEYISGGKTGLAEFYTVVICNALKVFGIAVGNTAVTPLYCLSRVSMYDDVTVSGISKLYNRALIFDDMYLLVSHKNKNSKGSSVDNFYSTLNKHKLFKPYYCSTEIQHRYMLSPTEYIIYTNKHFYYQRVVSKGYFPGTKGNVNLKELWSVDKIVSNEETMLRRTNTYEDFVQVASNSKCFHRAITDNPDNVRCEYNRFMKALGFDDACFL